MNKLSLSSLEAGQSYVVRFRGEYVIGTYLGSDPHGKRVYYSFRIGDEIFTDTKSYLQVFELDLPYTNEPVCADDFLCDDTDRFFDTWLEECRTLG